MHLFGPLRENFIDHYFDMCEANFGLVGAFRVCCLRFESGRSVTDPKLEHLICKRTIKYTSYPLGYSQHMRNDTSNTLMIIK